MLAGRSVILATYKKNYIDFFLSQMQSVN